MPSPPRLVVVLVVASLLGSPGSGQEKPASADKKPDAGKKELPLESVRNTQTLRYVMENGELRDADTLDEVWPTQKKLPRQHCWDLEPNLRKGAPARPGVSRPIAPTTR